MDKKPVKVYGAALLFSTLVGFSFLGIKAGIPYAAPLEILTWRYNVSAAAVVIMLLVSGKKLAWKGKPRKAIFLTALFYVLFMALQAVGLAHTTSIVSGIIFAFVPILAKIIARFFLGEQSVMLQNAFVLLSVAALVLLFVKNSDRLDANLLGIVLLLISSTCMAFSNVFMRYVRKDYNPAEVTLVLTVVGFAAFNAVTLASGLKNGFAGSYFLPLTHRTFVFSVLYLGLGCTFFSGFLASYMLANLEAVKATMFGNLSAAISVVAGALILKEPLELYHLICTGLIIAGVIGVSATGTRTLPRHEGKEEGKT